MQNQGLNSAAVALLRPINRYDMRAKDKAHLIQLERGIAAIPSVFKFHGITEDTIKEAGITPEELAYLVASTTAGGVYHRTHSPCDEKAFTKGSYRYCFP